MLISEVFNLHLLKSFQVVMIVLVPNVIMSNATLLLAGLTVLSEHDQVVTVCVMNLHLDPYKLHRSKSHIQEIMPNCN